MELLSLSIGSNPSKLITKIDLANNKIGDAGASHLARALPRLDGLEVLGLTDNAIRDKGVADIAEALKPLKVFEELNLGNNVITYVRRGQSSGWAPVSVQLPQGARSLLQRHQM